MLTPRTVQTLPGGVRIESDTRSVSTALIPFIRPRKVFFRAEGLLPNTKHRPYFDGVDVTDWCREETFLRSNDQPAFDAGDAASLTEHPETKSDLISDANGIIEGSFFLPNTDSIRFRTGAREFKLLDWNATTDSNSISSCFITYTAQGTLETLENTITTIMPAPSPPPVRQIDPVAQSFIIERAGGAFVTSLDIFFAKRSTTVPVRLQIRTMENGTPTSNVVPGAEVFVLPSFVETSASPDKNNADTATTFTFEAPVFLDGFVEYAIVILAESDDYEVWTAVTKEYVVGSNNRRIMKQPALGSFFKSQNGSTWTPDQSRDLMFVLKRAEFGTSGTAHFENEDISKVAMISNPLNVLQTGADPTVRVLLANHGLYVGSKFTLSGSTNARGILAAALNGTHTVTAVEGLDSFIITLTGSTSTGTGRAGGSNCIGSRNLQYTLAYPNVNQLTLDKTVIDWTAKRTTGQSPSALENPYNKSGIYTPLLPNVNNEYDSPQVIASPDNETEALGTNRSLTMRAQLTTSDTYISPVVDLSRLSINTIANRIDRQAATETAGYNVPGSYIDETDPSLGSHAAKHVTIPITLEEPALGLKVIFAANRPADSEIELYYRTLPVGSTEVIGEIDWVLAEIDSEVQSDEDPTIFREYRYTIPTLGELESFDTFQFKFVFKSTNMAMVPRIKDLRGIALAT